ncbi:hypothetical protein Gorai_024236, partial [Gossypium raimondii]|nr:hypothetical protein [Gossypium raimondii]
MENEIADLSISDGEEDVWQIMEDDEQMTSPHMFDLVGYFSTACVVHFQAMRNTMANIWHLLGGYDNESCENFCPIRTAQGNKVMDMGWDISLRAGIHLGINLEGQSGFVPME